MMDVPVIWTDEQVARASRLWSQDGLTAAEIAAAMEEEFGVARSRQNIAAFASRNRHLFPPRGQGHARAAAKRASAAAKSLRTVAAPAAAVAEASPRVSSADAAYDAASLHLALDALGACQCRWPVNEPPRGEAHLFCGGAARPGRSYCDHHAGRASGGVWGGLRPAEAV